MPQEKDIIEFSASVDAPFPITPSLVEVAVAYQNEDLIADDVLPRVPVGTRRFSYFKYELGDAFTIPSTIVGRKSVPNEVEFGATEATESVKNYALDEIVPVDDIETAPDNYDPLKTAVKTVAGLIALDREARVAGLVFNSASYGAANKTALTGAGQYSDPASDPIKGIHAALDACVMRPNVMVIGQSAWTALRQHPKIVKASNRNSGDSGAAAREAVAEMFELKKILVGSGWRNTAKKGQSVTTARLWGKHIALIYQDGLLDTGSRVTFGFTAQHGNFSAGQIPEPKVGLRGAIRVRAGESVRELITAPDLGYFIENAVA